MKKAISILVLLVLFVTTVGCSGYVSDDTYNDVSNDTPSYTIDYIDAESFESALNEGDEVEDKIVQFLVLDYVPDSALGINCHAGEHLNFIFDEEIDVNKNDTIIVRITEQPSKVFLLGSWKVPCEFLEISEKGGDASDTTEDSKPEKITVTMSEEEFKEMTTAEAEEKLREMGFTVFKYDTLDAGDRDDLDGKIGAVEIKTWTFGKGDFSKGDTYKSDAIVVLWSFEYTKYTQHDSVPYSTNDYETATKGNTGVFAYKSQSGSYDRYWIIDFDEGYVYNFSHGNFDDTCDKVKIVSGDLNDRMKITWHAGGDQWSWYLHFKYVNSPTTLVVNDHYGSSMEFATTNLSNALSIRKTKTINEY